MSINLAELNLPKEISVKDAAAILNIDRKTVLAYIKEGVLPARDVAVPSSKRPLWRLRLADVMEMRTAYRRYEQDAGNHKSNSNGTRPRTARRYEPKLLKRRS